MRRADRNSHTDNIALIDMLLYIHHERHWGIPEGRGAVSLASGPTKKADMRPPWFLQAGRPGRYT
ncbi:hypothetical protein, partial [Escherichia coli]|uniref:hypothetical protein n=1 Tax=Escherichia coli TaxID=562 RepID=UPI001F4B582E